MADNFSVRQSLVDCCRQMYDKGLVGGSQGNASVRYNTDCVFITPAGSNLGRLKANDLITLSMSGRKLSGDGEQSSEYLLHLGIYNQRADVQAICHAHPLAATAFAIVDLDPNRPVLPEVSSYLGNICTVDYVKPGTPGLFERLASMLEESDTFLLRNHGAVTTGANLEDAFNRMEILERYARILIYANQLGPIRQVPIEQIRDLPGCRELEARLKAR